jgi:hypothetical protein
VCKKTHLLLVVPGLNETLLTLGSEAAHHILGRAAEVKGFFKNKIAEINNVI